MQVALHQQGGRPLDDTQPSGRRQPRAQDVTLALHDSSHPLTPALEFLCRKEKHDTSRVKDFLKGGKTLKTLLCEMKEQEDFFWQIFRSLSQSAEYQSR